MRIGSTIPKTEKKSTPQDARKKKRVLDLLLDEDLMAENEILEVRLLPLHLDRDPRLKRNGG